MREKFNQTSECGCGSGYRRCDIEIESLGPDHLTSTRAWLVAVFTSRPVAFT